MKKVFYGWIGKSVTEKDITFKTDDYTGGCIIDIIYLDKGRKDMWDEIDWPTRKVKITVEDV